MDANLITKLCIALSEKDELSDREREVYENGLTYLGKQYALQSHIIERGLDELTKPESRDSTETTIASSYRSLN